MVPRYEPFGPVTEKEPSGSLQSSGTAPDEKALTEDTETEGPTNGPASMPEVETGGCEHAEESIDASLLESRRAFEETVAGGCFNSEELRMA